MTANRFIENPFLYCLDDDIKNKYAYLYKTGDLGKYLHDGRIEYVGRVDRQIKIRGFRIELEEIENVLNKHVNVKNIVVLDNEYPVNNKILIAYVVHKSGIPAKEKLESEADTLKKYSTERLPDYMIPSFFVFLDKLPLTPNGKLDRKALPIPDYKYTDQHYIIPQTNLEKALVESWQKILHIESVGTDDNFFEMGGNSILAIQLVNFLKKHYNIEIPVKTLFECSTIPELVLFIKNNNTSIKSIPRLISIERPPYVPLSFAQQRLWFFDQLNPNNPVYNMSLLLKFKGKIKRGTLRKAIHSLARRHEILRTSFKFENDQPFQYIHSSLDFNISYQDFSKLTNGQREEQTKVYISKEILKPFNLKEDQLLRISLIKIRDNEYIFSLILHHIVADEWSLNVIMKELSELYNAHLQNEKPIITSLPVQYADYALWEKECLKENNETFKKQLSYWLNQLKDAPQCLNLPFDAIRPKVKTYKGNQINFRLDTLLSKEIKLFCLKNNTTIFVFLFSIFHVLLHRYSGQENIVVGFPITNRNEYDLKDLIGFFANTLPLKSKVTANITFGELLSQIKEKILEAQENRDIPLEKIIEHLNIERNLSEHPLFQIMFSFENELKLYPLKNIQLEIESINSPVAKFDLTLIFHEKEDFLSGTVEYSTDIFGAYTIEKMIKHLESLIEEVINFPNKKIGYLNFLTSDEKKQLLVEWNTKEINYSSDQTICQLFEIQVKKTPDNICVVSDNKEITYQELNQKANRLAHFLKKNAFKADALIGIACERSIEMVIGVLGILKAGYAYVPIDPSSPMERLSYILKDTKITFLLTQEHLLKKLPKNGLHIILIDKIDEKSDFGNFNNPISIIQPFDLAYVIYTSGTSGRPKGVMIEHKSICEKLNWFQEFIPLSSSDKYLHQFSFGFDGAVVSLLWPLLNGATVFIPTDEELPNFEFLSNLIKLKQITTIFSTPAIIDLVLNYNNISDFSTIKRIIFAGEVLKNETFRKIKEKSQGKLYNFYGPTECSVISTGINLDFLPLEKIPPIGKPIANAKVYILDSLLNLVPIGVTGELYIGGEGLARGYLNQPELTKKKFINNPFRTEEDKFFERNSKMYKTGDLCQWLPDGNISYIGRIDEQVKIRGFRVEIEEIESVLLQHVNVRHTKVIVKEDSIGEKKIIAYIVQKEKNQDIEELRNFVKNQLPSYMIPAAFVVLEALPLTINGKIDYKALPDPLYETFSKNYVAPRTKMEKTLVKIWQEILNMEKISVDDNFFNVGGHSLLIAQLMYKINNELQKKISLSNIFTYQTIEDLANFLESLSIYEKNDIIEKIKFDLEMGEKVNTTFKRLPVSSQNNILLTGANGFLGVHLLNELLKSTQGNIYCLLRHNPERSLQTFEKSLQYYNLDSLKNDDRIIPIFGDLAKPQLGLTNLDWNLLAENVDVIYHNGASVNHLYDYDKLRPENVLSTIELLTLSSMCRPKHFHYVSTISTGIEHKKEKKIVLEDFQSPYPTGKESGYVLSKWTSEQILGNAIKRGFSINIYRPPQIMGHTVTGTMPFNNIHVLLFLKGCIQLGIAPKDFFYFSMLPVDFLSNVIVKIATDVKEMNKVYNLVCPGSPSLTHIFDWLIEIGYNIEMVSKEEWNKNVLPKITENNAFFPLIPLYLHGQEEKKSPVTEIITKNFDTFLTRENLTIPKLDRELFLRYFNFLKPWLTEKSPVTEIITKNFDTFLTRENLTIF